MQGQVLARPVRIPGQIELDGAEGKVGPDRLLLDRLGVHPSRARGFTLVFGLSATQVVFSSLPETHAFSALGLVLVFLVSAPPSRSLLARVGGGRITLSRVLGESQHALLIFLRHLG